MKLISVRQLIRITEKAGWEKIAQNGSHLQYRHPTKKGKITIPVHRLGNTIPIGTEKRILKLILA